MAIAAGSSTQIALFVAPVLVLFVALQRYYIESVAAGALKE